MPAKLLSSPGDSLRGRLAAWLATGVGVGFVAPAPGTIGGLWGVPLVLLIDKLPNIEVQLAVVAALLLAAVGVCHIAAQALGAASDPQVVVLDEIVALPIVFLGSPPLTWGLLLAGFLLFRLFDIWKPGLVREFEKIPGGWGIVADDAAAATLALAVLRGLVWLDVATSLHWLAA